MATILRQGEAEAVEPASYLYVEEKWENRMRAKRRKADAKKARRLARLAARERVRADYAAARTMALEWTPTWGAAKTMEALTALDWLKRHWSIGHDKDNPAPFTKLIYFMAGAAY